MNRIFVIIAIVIPQSLMAAQTSTYSGQESRVIKSLSEQEIESLRSGDGMGFAKAAELNHYPGPRHVLMLAGKLRLTVSQQFRTQALYDNMRGDAVLLGRELVRAEEELDQLFSGETVNAESLEKTLQNIGHLHPRHQSTYHGYLCKVSSGPSGSVQPKPAWIASLCRHGGEQRAIP